MTLDFDTPRTVVSDPDNARGIWFMGSLARVQLGSDQTAGQLAVLEHSGPRGYSAPMHRHLRDDETFIVLEGTLHVISDGQAYEATAGTTLFLPKLTLHGFVVTEGTAHFLTVHTPGGFDTFSAEAGHEVILDGTENAHEPPAGLVPPTREELTRIAVKYGIEIVGPPPALPDAE